MPNTITIHDTLTEAHELLEKIDALLPGAPDVVAGPLWEGRAAVQQVIRICFTKQVARLPEAQRLLREAHYKTFC